MLASFLTCVKNLSQPASCTGGGAGAGSIASWKRPRSFCMMSAKVQRLSSAATALDAVMSIRPGVISMLDGRSIIMELFRSAGKEILRGLDLGGGSASSIFSFKPCSTDGAAIISSRKRSREVRSTKCAAPTHAMSPIAFIKFWAATLPIPNRCSISLLDQVSVLECKARSLTG